MSMLHVYAMGSFASTLPFILIPKNATFTKIIAPNAFPARTSSASTKKKNCRMGYNSVIGSGIPFLPPRFCVTC